MCRRSNLHAANLGIASQKPLAMTWWLSSYGHKAQHIEIVAVDDSIRPSLVSEMSATPCFRGEFRHNSGNLSEIYTKLESRWIESGL